jgi:hypothetical protein
MTTFHIPGVRCPCGSPDLVIGCPGTDPVTSEVLGPLLPATPGYGWCSIEHARADGWPWLKSESPKQRRRA